MTESRTDTTLLKYSEALAREATEDLVRTLVYFSASFGSGGRWGVGVSKQRSCTQRPRGRSLQHTFKSQLIWEPGGSVEGWVRGAVPK